MTPEEFQSAYPLVISWARQTLAAHENSSKKMVSFGFSRLPLYFSQEMLKSTKVVVIEKVPVPPLSAIGLSSVRGL